MREHLGWLARYRITGLQITLAALVPLVVLLVTQPTLAAEADGDAREASCDAGQVSCKAIERFRGAHDCLHAAIGNLRRVDRKPVLRISLPRRLAREDRVWPLLLTMLDEGAAPNPLLPKETLLSISAHVDPDVVDETLARLADPATTRRLAGGREDLSALLAGLANLRPLIERMEPQAQWIVARPRFADDAARPDVVLPAVAMVFQPRDPEKAKLALMASYLAAMHGANFEARAHGRPSLEMDSRQIGRGFYAGSAFRTDGPAAYPPGAIEYNLSPAIGIVDERFIIASNRQLASDLVELAQRDAPAPLERRLRIDIGPRETLELVLDNLSAPRTGMLGERTIGSTRQLIEQLPLATMRVPDLDDLLPVRLRFRIGERRGHN